MELPDDSLEKKLVIPTDRRVWGIAEALYKGQGWDKHRV